MQELKVGAAKQTAASHRAEIWSRVKVTFLSFHQSCQSWQCFGRQSGQSVWSVRGPCRRQLFVHGNKLIWRVIEVS